MRSQRGRRRSRSARPLILAALLAAGALSSVTHAAAEAATGVSIDLGSVTITQPLNGGDRYDLPRFNVSNPGDEAASYEMNIGALEGDGKLSADASWVTFTPAEFTLEPGQARAVHGQLALPDGASPGSYVVLVRAQLRTRGEGSLVGAAAAARLQFDVVEMPAGRAASQNAKVQGHVFDLAGPWAYVAAVMLLLVAVAISVGRRYRISIRRR